MPEPEETVVIFSADVDQIQSYVFESSRLPEIRGASRQLNELNKEDTVLEHFAEISGSELIYAGGGSVLMLLPDVPDDVLEQVEMSFHRTYASVTDVVTITCAWDRFPRSMVSGKRTDVVLKGSNPKTRYLIDTYTHPEGKDKPKVERHHFGEVRTIMARHLRKKKNAHRSKPFFERMPFSSVCTSCENRPANVLMTYTAGETPTLLCRTCHSKAKEGQGTKRNVWISVLEQPLADQGYIISDSIQYPPDIESIVRKPTTENGRPEQLDDIAFIYADGDDMGSQLLSLDTPQDFEQFSHDIEQALIQATAFAIANNPDLAPKTISIDDEPTTVYPWEVITIGGDDLLMLVPAAAAFQFATDLAEAFFNMLNPSRLSVGIAIGQPKTPVRRLRDIAYSALRSAKKRSYATREPAIDYHNIVTEGFVPQNLSVSRTMTQLVDPPTNPGESRNTNYWLTGRPYSLSMAKQLQTSISLLREFPKSQLQHLRSEMRKGRTGLRGSLYYYYMRARLNTANRARLDELEALWQASLSIEEGSWPWMSVSALGDGAESDQQEFFTIFADILDLP